MKLSRTGKAAILVAALVFMSCGQAFAFGVAKESGNPHEAGDMDMPPPVAGKVLETMNAGGYTYLLLEQHDGNKVWLAAPEMKGVKAGQVLMFRPGYSMPNFKSSALKRTFDSIIFSPGPMDASMVKGYGGPFSPGSTGAVPEQQADVKTEKAEGTDAYTVGEVYQKAGKLSGKEVSVRGKVVKASSGIMGKNWLHVQDGTGSTEKGTHDLVVTTADTAGTGDTVTVKGKVVKDKDFGAGYKYDVIMEDAAVSK